MRGESIMKKIAVIGCTGRMGLTLMAQVETSLQCELAGAVTRHGNPLIGQDACVAAGLEPSGLEISSTLPEGCDVGIDFSRPEATLEILPQALKLSLPLVIATTGFDEAQRKTILEASKHIPIVLAPNTSLGIAVLRKLSVMAAHMLGPDYDVDILDTHHRYKVDAPSGTALSLGESLAHTPGFHLSHVKDVPRARGSIHITARRTGGVVGVHEISMASDHEIISLTHTAITRDLFAEGAIKAALWVSDQNPGLYTMDDVVGI